MKFPTCFSSRHSKRKNPHLCFPWDGFRHGCDPPNLSRKITLKGPSYDFWSDSYQSVSKHYFRSPILSSPHYSIRNHSFNYVGQPSVLCEKFSYSSPADLTEFPDPEALQKQQKTRILFIHPEGIMKPFKFFMMTFFACQLLVDTPWSTVLSLNKTWGEPSSPMLQNSIPSGEPPALQLTLERPVHFTAADDNDLLVEPGKYEVEAGEEDQIWLIATQSREAFHLKALPSTHEEIVDEPHLVSTSDQEGRFDVVLLLPDGNSLNAVGSYSGIQSRGMLFKPLSRASLGRARQQASSQSVQTPIATPPAPPCSIRLLWFTPPSIIRRSFSAACFKRSTRGDPSQLQDQYPEIDHLELCPDEPARYDRSYVT